MRMLKLVLPAAVLAAGFLALTATSYAKPEYTKKENKPCTFCHVKAGSHDLNDSGKYYKEKKTLKGLKVQPKKK
jgi:hypothetical protein